MNQFGFFLTRLILTGNDVPDAEVNFTNGLNVIYGPSDTGKTFIAQCIDFMLGGSRQPSEVKEATSYESLQLGIRSRKDENEFILKRSLRGGDFYLQTKGKQELILGGKHQAENTDTVSHFLLNLSGLTGKKIQMDQRGNTRSLSFRDLAKLTLVTEQDVIREESPIHSGQRTSRTEEKSVFRLLLSGIDDGSLIAKEDPKVAKGRREGKTEAFAVLISRAYAQLTELHPNSDIALLERQLNSSDTVFDTASKELDIEQEKVTALEKKRKMALNSLRETESKLTIHSELQKRFGLLKQQYHSDLRRLETIVDASHQLGQMQEERCPVCGSKAEYHNTEHQNPQINPEDVINASKTEIEKTHALLLDLNETLVSNGKNINEVEKICEVKESELKHIDDELKTSLQPRLQAALNKLKAHQAERETYIRAIDLHRYIKELEYMLSEAKKTPKRESLEKYPINMGTYETEQLSQEVEALLREWDFPDLDRVVFNEKDTDIVISGKPRASHGKGVRAITHAAFSLGLLNYCLKHNRHHPGFVLIDSPLVVYQQPGAKEDGKTYDVKASFYHSLARDFKSSQVIIVENEIPPSDLSSSINLIEFTKADYGRYGFIPWR